MSQLHLRACALSILALTALGCDESTTLTDAGSSPTDAGTGTPDAAATDAAAPDAGPLGECMSATLCGDVDIVVDAEWLAMHLGDADLQIVDVRDEADFVASHIEGAVRIDGGALRATVDGIRGQVVTAAVAEGVFSAAGLQPDNAVIVYGASTGTGPARLVWTLEYFGHERVALLEGGFATWNDGSRATATGASTPTASTYAVTAIDENRRVDADFISARLDDATLALVDARTDGEYSAGHIPGALSVDWTRNLMGNDLIDEAALRALYTTIDASGTTVAYCQTGSRASVTYVVLRSLGFADVRLYDGSWTEWGSRPELPREP